MTIITCKECLHKVVCPICFSYKDVLNVKDYCEHFVEKSALEKQIPKKPIKDEYGFLHCPYCDDDDDSLMHDSNFSDRYNYCCYCGQALDWSDTE